MFALLEVVEMRNALLRLKEGWSSGALQDETLPRVRRHKATVFSLRLLLWCSRTVDEDQSMFYDAVDEIM